MGGIKAPENIEEMIVNIGNLKETENFARRLADTLKPGDVLGLAGDLGTGKTTLTSYIARGLGVKENVVSPTFNIVREYCSGRLPLFHFDVYRLGGAEDLFDIGAEEYFYDRGGVSVVEWADTVREALPEHTKYIYIERGGEEEERIYRCTFSL